MFFNNFPVTFYTDLFGKTTTIVDIARRVKVIEEFKNSLDLYTTYTVRDGERPEHVAYKFYGNPELHWILLLLNDIIDVYRDWPLSQIELERMIADKYPNPNAVKHREYILDDGTRVVLDQNSSINKTPIDATKLRDVTFAEFESEENDRKREVRVLREQFIPILISQFNEEINR